MYKHACKTGLEPLNDALIIALACDDLTIALGLLRSCLASVKP
jgi:hypothetical protein